MTEYTLVRHSGYALAANPALDDAVEVHELSGQQSYLVRAAGGVVFTTLAAAQAAQDRVNLADGSPPRAPGYFSSLRIGSAEIYVPQ
ncbi:conserved protein of unknown function [Rhodovastum atsumiense]|uniref:Uncharacterized protein n=1 Tax=Rhodovastum atsumiense TaxID=504468 RepID=A0A5M6IP17_9PROT|nr:hypothetical protein [Rhodovastum atsumiense]KAA5610023.1 hypothetical protein F1189_21190 [Rhodovastum atsumiense]CAH2602992.1 conserved protein of unknown function [Rhodovastum atsumiense]